MCRSLLALLLSAAALCVAPAAASASGVAYPDADWSEAFFTSSGGVTLHADVLRPKGATDADKTPVILSIGPYFNHSGQTGPAGPAEGTRYDPVGPNAGPSERFQDFVEGSGLLKKGYSFVMVDLRGFGGSNGCLDWSGPGEKADVVHAVQWAASRPWSNGRVGMYGKSYDGLTGLIGVGLRPAGLAAVVSQEPVYDDYRYLYGDGMRRLNSVATPVDVPIDWISDGEGLLSWLAQAGLVPAAVLDEMRTSVAPASPRSSPTAAPPMTAGRAPRRTGSSAPASPGPTAAATSPPASRSPTSATSRRSH